MPQLSLPGIEEPDKNKHRLFFAVFPSAPAVDQIATRAKQFFKARGIRRKPTPSERLHISLHHVGDYRGFPWQVINKTCAAADTVSVKPFRVSFDHAATFEKRSPRRPLVLLADEASFAGLKALYEALALSLMRAGFRVPSPELFRPHITLQRDEQVIDEAFEAVEWTVEEFVLIDRPLEGYDYEVVRRWPLRA